MRSVYFGILIRGVGIRVCFALDVLLLNYRTAPLWVCHCCVSCCVIFADYRTENLDFYISTGKVIKAWDLGVATMRRGELSVLTCKPEYAYGDTGAGDKIPPNATLIFEVELLDWKG